MTDNKKGKRGLGLAAVFGHPIDSKTVSQHDSMAVNTQDSGPARNLTIQTAFKPEDRNKVKATYYIEPQLIKQLKLLAVERNTDLSALVSEAIEDLVGKAKGM